MMTATPRERIAPLLTRKQAAELLGFSIKKVYNLGRAGILKEVRIGGSVRYDQADIESLITAAKEVRHG